jgi:hypothetical protein
LTELSNYAAEIVRVPELKKVDGLDNLRQVEILGYSALVHPGTTREGDEVVMFVAGTQLSPGFARANNLYRKPSLNANATETGYLEDDARVKAIKLRGHRSNALLLPVGSLVRAGVDSSQAYQIEVGARFEDIGDLHICSKWTNPEIKRQQELTDKRSKRSDKAALKSIYEAAMPQHVDTPHWLRVSGQMYSPEQEVVVTVKLHGCFHANTRVLMWDGTRKFIRDVRQGDLVLGFDHNAGKWTPSRVREAFTTGTTEKWLRTEFNTLGVGGQNPAFHSTPEHRVFTSNRGYVEAEALRSDDHTVRPVQYPEVTTEKLEVLRGMILGDGSFANTNPSRAGNWSIDWSIKADDVEYMHYLKDRLGNLADRTVGVRLSGFGTEMRATGTTRHPVIAQLHDEWFKDGVKRVPSGFRFTDESLAVFYMDDGTLAHSEYQKDRATIALGDFDDLSIERLDLAFRAYGCDNITFYKSGNGRTDNEYWYVRLNNSSAEYMWEKIRPYVPEVMERKLPAYLRGLGNKAAQLDDSVTWYSMEQVVAQSTMRTVAEMSPKGRALKSNATKWDLETETHNFVAGSTLVHNSSHRQTRAMIPAERPNWFRRALMKLTGQQPVTHRFAALYGSRRVVKGEVGNEFTNTPSGFYKVDIWAEVAAKLEPKIPAGFTVYGEIVGYAGDKIIQRDYAYGCKPGEHKFYAYRVTFTPKDGEPIDLSWDALVEWCAMRGIATPATLWRGKAKDFDHEPWMDVRYADLGYSTPLPGKGMPDEGVVVRQEGIRPMLAKCKAQSFLEHETKMADKGEIDTEDAA